MPAGRPKQDKYEIDCMISRIEEYTESNKKDLPILKECCIENDWDYDYVMKLQRKESQLRQSIKKLLNQKEINLEKGGLFGKYNNIMAIFSLKQLGWRDKVDIATTDAVVEKVDELIGAIDNAGIRAVSGKEGLIIILGNTKGTLQRNIIEPLQKIYTDALVSDIRSDNTAVLFGEKCYCLGADKINQVNRIRGSSIKY